MWNEYCMTIEQPCVGKFSPISRSVKISTSVFWLETEIRSIYVYYRLASKCLLFFCSCDAGDQTQGLAGGKCYILHPLNICYIISQGLTSCRLEYSAYLKLKKQLLGDSPTAMLWTQTWFCPRTRWLATLFPDGCGERVRRLKIRFTKFYSWTETLE